MSETSEKTSTQVSHNKKRIIIITIAISIFILLGLTFSLLYVFVFSKYESTDNAYVNGNVVRVNSEIKGTVTAVYVDDTRLVKEGDILVKLNSQDYEIALEKARAALGSTVRQLREQYSNVCQYKAMIIQQKVALDKAEKDYKRRVYLGKKNIVSKEEISHAWSAVLNARAALKVTIEQERIANSNIDGIPLEQHPMLLHVKADFMEAWLNLDRTTIYAPISGYVAKKNVQVGNTVVPGTTLLSIVCLDQLWIDANFKETQLKHIKVNQNVEIRADVYGRSVKYTGKVVGLSAGTGSAFSLLPAQNATGNWIKIVQRLPVRIAIDPNKLIEHPLHIGFSTTVTVDIKDQSGESIYKAFNHTPYITNVITKNLTKAEEAANQIIQKNLTHSNKVHLDCNIKEKQVYNKKT